MSLGFEPDASSDRAASEVIRTVTSATFPSLVLQGSGPIVVEFMSYACSHCRELEPIIEQVAEMSRSKGTFFRVNVAADPPLADAFAIAVTPTLIMFRDGRKVGRVEGPRPSVASILTAVALPFRAPR